MTTKTSIFSSVISGSPMITSEKLVGSENYLSWSASVELWFMGQGYEDHLVTQEADIPEAKGLYTNDIQRLYKVTSAIVHISQQDLDLSTYIGQIASLKEEFLTVMPLTPDVGAQQTQLDKFFMVLTLIGLRPDLEPVRDQILGSSSVPSLDDVFARLLRISSTQTLPSDSISDSSVLVSHTTSRGGRSGNRGRGQRPHCTYCNKLGHTRDRCYQLHGRPPCTAHSGNASACLTHTSSLGPWILDSGASDHISGNKDLFSSITITSALPTVTLANGSQTVAKGPEYGEDDWHRTRLGHPSLSKFQKMFALPIVSPDVVPPRPLQVYHRRPRVAAPLPFAEAPADSLPIPSASPAPLCLLLMIYPLLFGKSTHEALSHPGWRQAMVDEMDALHSNGTWDLVVLPSGKSTVGCRWVYAVKVGPDGQIASVRLLLSMAAMCSWPLYQLDIKNAFLHGDLAEEVYMEQPPGFVAQGELCIYLVVYVDDIVITGSDQDGIQKLKQHLFTHFQTKDLGKLKYFLGIEIAQSSSSVVLSQRKYALDILEETGGAFRRPWEISTARSHWDAVIRILRYIKSTPGQGVLYENRGHTQVVGYTDADWAGSPTDRRSTSGYCVFIGGNLISWKSKKQDVVARYSVEAEYRAMALATCELIWLRHLLRELRFGKDEQMKLICDNQATLHIASIQSFMKGPNILKLTVTSLERRSHQDVLLQVLLIQMIN
ncbi:Retrovirus-related Pol polyprotein from transposon RE2 [Vitis vinifera]|uniref:Retrovirus-related Pol polyprotein from transposon RE2 n=1 Tax=Vitis vinifera TaxID=29760 RepID=A0A438I888_VITVI|nr:Retrovirus-related Pol polyprotein from transposon RE2 [Vitis vinifera]